MRRYGVKRNRISGEWMVFDRHNVVAYVTKSHAAAIALTDVLYWADYVRANTSQFA